MSGSPLQDGNGSARKVECAILILGASNSGKTTFINWALDSLGEEFGGATNERGAVRMLLDSQTSLIQSFVLHDNPEQRLVLVDTPGFDHTVLGDWDVAKSILNWVISSYSKGVRIVGVVHLHDISLDHIPDASRTDSEFVKRLCGAANIRYGFASVASTKWIMLPNDQAGPARERTMARSLWADFLGEGGQAGRIITMEDAGRMVKEVFERASDQPGGLLGKDGEPILRFQQEVLEHHRRWHETDVGHFLKLPRQPRSYNMGETGPGLVTEPTNGAKEARRFYDLLRNLFKPKPSKMEGESARVADSHSDSDAARGPKPKGARKNLHRKSPPSQPGPDLNRPTSEGPLPQTAYTGQNRNQNGGTAEVRDDEIEKMVQAYGGEWQDLVYETDGEPRSYTPAVAPRVHHGTRGLSSTNGGARDAGEAGTPPLHPSLSSDHLASSHSQSHSSNRRNHPKSKAHRAASPAPSASSSSSKNLPRLPPPLPPRHTTDHITVRSKRGALEVKPNEVNWPCGENQDTTFVSGFADTLGTALGSRASSPDAKPGAEEGLEAPIKEASGSSATTASENGGREGNGGDTAVEKRLSGLEVPCDVGDDAMGRKATSHVLDSHKVDGVDASKAENAAVTDRLDPVQGEVGEGDSARELEGEVETSSTVGSGNDDFLTPLEPAQRDISGQGGGEGPPDVIAVPEIQEDDEDEQASGDGGEASVVGIVTLKDGSDSLGALHQYAHSKGGKGDSTMQGDSTPSTNAGGDPETYEDSTSQGQEDASQDAKTKLDNTGSTGEQDAETKISPEDRKARNEEAEPNRHAKSAGEHGSDREEGTASLESKDSSNQPSSGAHQAESTAGANPLVKGAEGEQRGGGIDAAGEGEAVDRGLTATKACSSDGEIEASSTGVAQTASEALEAKSKDAATLDERTTHDKTTGGEEQVDKGGVVETPVAAGSEKPEFLRPSKDTARVSAAFELETAPTTSTSGPSSTATEPPTAEPSHDTQHSHPTADGCDPPRALEAEHLEAALGMKEPTLSPQEAISRSIQAHLDAVISKMEWLENMGCRDGVVMEQITKSVQDFTAKVDARRQKHGQLEGGVILPESPKVLQSRGKRMSPNRKAASTKHGVEDPVLDGGRDTDIIIPVMGPTKAGKSSLINRICGTDQMLVGSRLVSCTAHLEAAVVSKAPKEQDELNALLAGRRIVLVDTPGFDDTYMGDDEILIRISNWLEASYRKKMLVGGVIYLHDISRDGFPGSAMKNLTLFNKLCGDDAMDLVHLVTSKWDRLQSVEEGEEHVAELSTSQDIWAPMIALGASVHHLTPDPNAKTAGRGLVEGTAEGVDPWEVIHNIVVCAEFRDRVLLIQDELVRHEKFLTETQAGQELRMSLKQLLSSTIELKKKAKREAKEGKSTETLKKRQQEIEKLTCQLKNMKAPTLGDRARRWIQTHVPWGHGGGH